MRKISVVASLLLASSISHGADAIPYPSHPIRFIVATPAGSTPDIGGRLVGSYLADDLGQAVVIENRPGVNGLIAAREVLKNTADGYTFLIAPSSTMSVTPHVYRKQAGTLLSDFVAVGQLYQTDISLIVSTSSGFTSVGDVVAAAKKAPGKLVASYAAVGSASHVAVELFKQAAGVDIYTVPFNGSPAAAMGVGSGNADLLFETIPSTEGVVASGKARRIAMTGARRFSLAPTVPTVAESGLPGYVVTTWAGIFAAKDVPKDRVERVSAALAKATKDPAFIQKLATAGVLPGEASSSSFQKLWKAETAMWQKTVALSPALQQER